MPAKAAISAHVGACRLLSLVFNLVALVRAGAGAASTMPHGLKSTQLSVIGPCAFAFDSAGVQYDLSPLAGAVQTISGGDGFNYSFVLCAYLPAPTSPCLNRASSSSQLVPGSMQCLVALGDAVATVAAAAANPANGLTVTMPQGAPCVAPSGGSFETTLALSCDKTLAAGTLVVDSVSKTPIGDSCELSIMARAASACPGPYTPPAVRGLGAAYIATGAVLVILLGYVGGGTVYKSVFLKKTGAEAIPNIDTWRCMCRALSCRGTRRHDYEPASSAVYGELQDAAFPEPPSGFVDVMTKGGSGGR